MAKQEDSFLFRLKLLLDDDKAVAQMRSQFHALGQAANDVNQNLAQANASLVEMGVHGEDIEQAFARVPGRMSQVRQSILQGDAALENLAASSRGAWGSVQTGALQASNSAQTLRKSLVRTANAQQNLNRTQQGYRDLTRKTTQTSQNLLRIMQDSQFGMMGMANNIQALGESLGRAGTRGRTAFQQLFGGIKNLLTGPMALPAVITAVTLLAQNWDSVTQAVRKYGNQFGILDLREQANRVDELREALNKLKDETDDRPAILQEAEGTEAEDYFERIVGQKKEDVVSDFKSLRSEIDRLEESGMDIDLLRQQEEDENLTEYANRLERIQNQMGGRGASTSRPMFLAQSLEETARKAQEANFTMQNLNASTMTLQEEARKLAESDLFTYQQALKGLKLMQEDASDSGDDLNEVMLEQLGIRQELIREMEDVRESNLTERFPVLGATEQVDTEFDRRHQEIKQQFEEQRDEVRSELEKGTQKRQEKMEQINQREIQTLRTLEKRRRVALREERLEARAEATELIDQEMPDILDSNKFVWVNGRMVGQQNFVERQQEAWKQTQRELDNRRAELDAERSIGEMGGFFDKLEQEQIQFQLDMMKKEEELIKDRIRQQINYLETLLIVYDPDSQRYSEIENKIDRLNAKLARTEEKWYAKRENLQKEHLRKKVENLESSELGDATAGLVMDLGKIWQDFRSHEIKLSKMNAQEKTELFTDMGDQLMSSVDKMTSAMFSQWKERRSQELKDQGKSAEERRKIMKEEGRKRFQMMKNVKYANAAISGLEAQLHAWTQGMKMGGPPVAAAMSAASAAKTAFQLRKISQMSIGDKLSGTGGGGGGGPAGGEFTQLNQSGAALRAGDVATSRRQERNNQRQGSVENTAKKVGKEVARQMPDEVIMDRRTAAKSQRVGQRTNSKFNK